MASDYKRMGQFIEEDQELRAYLGANHCKVTGKRIIVITGNVAFKVLADLAERGFRFYSPANLAQAWGVSRQAVNNVIGRGLLVTIEYNGGSWSGQAAVDYKYVVFESIEGQSERTRKSIEAAVSSPATYFGVAAEPIRDAAGLIQEELPLAVGFEGLSAKEIAERDSICKEWRECSFRGTCFDLTVNWDCICQKDDGEIVPPAPELPAPPPSRPTARELYDEARLRGVQEALEFPVDAVNTTTAELYQEFPDARPSVTELGKHFRETEIKILLGGFSLVRYDRAEKKILKSYQDPREGWYVEGVFPTYAAAERRLAELLKDQAIVEVSSYGSTVNSKDEAKLRAAGFNFYRNAGMDFGEKWGRIKIGPTWSTFKKVETRAELDAAWSELMKDERALQG